jgi:hypothetical protein
MKSLWKNLRFFAASATFGALVLMGTSQPASAQVSINVNVGPAPVCPYGYFDYAPYRCAPFGYYAPQWFQGGLFIGAGPWFAGPVGFRGYFDRRFDPRFGYRGELPRRGERADWGRHQGWERNFHGSSYRTEVRHDNGNHNGQYNERGNQRGNGRGNDRGNGHDNGHGNDHGRGH